MADKKQQSNQVPAPQALHSSIGFGIKLSEWALAGVLGLGSGLLASVHKVHDIFRDDSKKATAFKGHYYGYEPKEWTKIVLGRSNEQYKAYAQDAGDSAISQRQWKTLHKNEIVAELNNRPRGRQVRLDGIELKNFIKAGKTGKEYREAIRDEKRAIEDEFEDIACKFRGIPKTRIGGTLAKLELMSPSSMAILAANGAVGAFIGAAMTVSFFNGVATRNRIDRIAQRTGADNDNYQEPVSTSHADKVSAEADHKSTVATR